LEASGRPSGTGRPSLPPPRADEHERADGADEAPQPEPFEKVLDDAETTAVAPGEARAPSAPPALSSVDSETRLAELATGAELTTGAELAAGAPPARAGAPHAGLLRPDALPLPASASLAPVGPAPEAKLGATPQGDSAVAAKPKAEAPPASAPDAAPLPAPERGEAPQALAPESRPDAARPSEAKAVSAPPAAPPPPAETARASEILRQLRVQLGPELRSATIQLSPPELGRISIRLRVERGELSAVVRAEKRETLAALQRHVPELEATLGQLGIRARQIDLQLGFEQQGARQDPNGSPDSQGSRRHEHEPLAREHERRLLRTLSARAGGIDTYA